MNTPPQISRPKRAIWPWVLLGIVVLPFVVLGATAASFLSLDRDAAILRRQVIKATDANWDTKVQVSVGRVSLGLLRTALACVQDDDIEDAKFALGAIRSASVGVYQLEHEVDGWDSAELVNKTDASMHKRGWVRAVGVNSGESETVMIYVRDGAAEPEEFCVAVVNRRDLVIVAARLDPDALGTLVGRHTREKLNLGRALKLAQQ